MTRAWPKKYDRNPGQLRSQSSPTYPANPAQTTSPIRPGQSGRSVAIPARQKTYDADAATFTISIWPKLQCQSGSFYDANSVWPNPSQHNDPSAATWRQNPTPVRPNPQKPCDDNSGKSTISKKSVTSKDRSAIKIMSLAGLAVAVTCTRTSSATVVAPSFALKLRI